MLRNIGLGRTSLVTMNALGERMRFDPARHTSDGRPVFGPHSSIATQAACGAVGGRFVPHLFGWMVHVNAFLADSGAVWGDPHGGAGH